jgi:hypothetical protein
MGTDPGASGGAEPVGAAYSRLGLHEYMEQNRATGKIVVTP